MKYRSIVAVAVVTLLSLVILALFAVKLSSDSPKATNEMKLQAEAAINLIEIGIHEAVMQGDTKRLTEQLNYSMRLKGLHHARVMSAEHTVLAEARQTDKRISENNLIKLSRSLYDNGRHIGWIETSFVIDSLQKEFETIYQPYQVSNLIMLGLSIFSVLLLMVFVLVKHKRELRNFGAACRSMNDEGINEKHSAINYRTILERINTLRSESRHMSTLLAISEQQQRQSKIGLELVEKFTYAGTWVWDFDTSSFSYSKEFLEIIGLNEGELENNYESFFQLIPDEERSDVEVTFRKSMQKHEPFETVHRVLHANGGKRTVKQRAKVILNNQGQASSIIGCMRDITERRQTKEDLALTSQVFEYSIEGIIITDSRGNILRVNKAFSDITGYSETEVIGSNPSILRSGRHAADFYKKMWNALSVEGHWHGEVWNRRKGGDVYPEWLAIRAVKDDSGHVNHYIGIFDDITEQKAAEERIERLASYDALTDLPNRLMFRGRLKMAMAEAEQNEQMLGVLSINLDRFNNINDTLGHAVGDSLLQLIAQRLKLCVRQGDTLARLGGDEFVIMLSDLHHEREVISMAEKILHNVAQPIRLDDSEVFITCSIGISMHSMGDDRDDLLKNATSAMFHVKEQSGNNYQFYRDEMNAAVAEQLFMENSLHRAQERSEFMLYYQPQVDLSSGEITGVESLIRWRHPELGQVRRDRFIPALEDTGLIHSVGEWVLRTACEQQVAWQKNLGKRLKVAVNLSPKQFSNSKRLFEIIRSVVNETGIEPEMLELEITEGSLMNHVKESAITLKRLKDMGIQLSIDDFGTGYSSLSYLKRFPVDTLKIDQSFVQGVSYDSDDAAITSTIIAMGHSLNLEVMAEGVETIEQLDFLSKHACNHMQGFFFSRPVPSDRITVLLENGYNLNDLSGS